jgi:hypothetical protein
LDWRSVHGNETRTSATACLQSADYEGEELEGTFYEQELQKVNKSDSDYYRVEKVLRSRMRNKRKEYYVKWLRYPDKFNSWVPAESVKDLK